MNPTNIRIARRLAVYALSLAEQNMDLHFFMGVGLSLGICFEEMTGRSCKQMKPQEIIEWAKNLPDERYPRVTL